MNISHNPNESIRINNQTPGGQPSKLLAMMCLVLLMGLIGVVTAGCRVSPATPTPSATPTTTPTITPVPPTAPAEESSAQPTEEPVLTTPTLAPTATPSQLDYVVDDIARSVGIDDLILFGLRGENLINLLISLLIVLLGSLLGVILVNGVLWLTKRTPPRFDDQLVESVEKQLKWLIALTLLQFATARLAFLPPVWKQWLDLAYFSLFVLVIASLVWKLIDYGLEGPLIRASSPENRNLLTAFAPLLRRLVQVAIFLVAVAIILQNIGINLSALLAVLGLGGLAVSLAAKESLEDMISGFIILIDRPFQIGDRIKIESMDSWGDVEAIGSRTTRIRTLDNRQVIVPNSVIGRNQIENYTHPDTNYRIDISLGIGYGSDIDQVIAIIEKAVLSVPDVLENPAPFVGFEEFGDSAMMFIVRYWLGSYSDIQVKTKVNKAIYESLTEANIEMPFTTYDVNLAYKKPPAGTNGEHLT